MNCFRPLLNGNKIILKLEASLLPGTWTLTRPQPVPAFSLSWVYMDLGVKRSLTYYPIKLPFRLASLQPGFFLQDKKHPLAYLTLEKLADFMARALIAIAPLWPHLHLLAIILSNSLFSLGQICFWFDKQDKGLNEGKAAPEIRLQTYRSLIWRSTCAEEGTERGELHWQKPEEFLRELPSMKYELQSGRLTQ